MKNVGMIAAGPVKKWVGLSREEFRRNGVFVLFCFVLFGGIVCGTLASGTVGTDTLKRLDFIFQTNFELRCSQGLISSFVSSFASAAIFLFVIFLLGLSLWGGFLSVALPFFKGYGYGLSAGFLYGAYGLKGIGYNLLVILPGMFFSSVIICSASLMSFCSSLKLCSCFFSAAVRNDPREQMKSYLLSILRCLLLCALAAVLDMFCSLCFSWIFTFS